jgi:hypothetical protein
LAVKWTSPSNPVKPISCFITPQTPRSAKQKVGDSAKLKDFFISYNKADRAWAEWIAWQLEEAGYSTEIQAWDFRPGSNFVLEMHRASQEAERTVAVLSLDSPFDGSNLHLLGGKTLV